MRDDAVPLTFLFPRATTLPSFSFFPAPLFSQPYSFQRPRRSAMHRPRAKCSTHSSNPLIIKNSHSLLACEPGREVQTKRELLVTVQADIIEPSYCPTLVCEISHSRTLFFLSPSHANPHSHTHQIVLTRITSEIQRSLSRFLSLPAPPLSFHFPHSDLSPDT